MWPAANLYPLGCSWKTWWTGLAEIAGRQSPRATSVSVFAPGSMSSSRAASCEFEPGDVMSATTVGDPISV